jgi:hypothetical protein
MCFPLFCCIIKNRHREKGVIMIQAKIVSFLKSYRNARITLIKIEQACPGATDYEEFANAILALEAQRVLTRVQSAGENGKTPALANKYNISKNKLNASHREEIKQLQLTIHPLLNLEPYYKLSAKEWHNDYPYIKKIDHYFKNNGIPQQPASLPQRSYELVTDEKWLEGAGLKLLERLDIAELLKIEKNPEPLMFAVSPTQFTAQCHLHLVVENKTTYYALSDMLLTTPFTSLIYGGGWKIAANIHNLPKQLNLPDSEHIIFYFGDLDPEGISIWWATNKKIKVQPAVAFYQVLLTKRAEYGKETQRLDQRALDRFLAYFQESEKQQLQNLLTEGRYYPQEALSADELQTIWRDTPWKTT